MITKIHYFKTAVKIFCSFLFSQKKQIPLQNMSLKAVVLLILCSICICHKYGVIYENNDENILKISNFQIKKFSRENNIDIELVKYQVKNGNYIEIIDEAKEDQIDYIFSYCNFDIDIDKITQSDEYPILFCFNKEVFPICKKNIVNSIPFPYLYDKGN